MKSRQSPLTILVIACLLLVTYLVSPVHAVQKSLAGKIDWHKSLIGVPRQDLTPAFISLLEGKDGLVLVTERNVLAVLDVGDGQVVWRQMLEPEDVVMSYEISADAIVVISGLETPMIRSFSLSSGHVQWETLLGSTTGQAPQQLYEPLDLGTKIISNGKGDVIVLSRGHVVNRLDGTTGGVKWTWTLDENVTGSTLVDVVDSPDGLTVISMIQSFASPQLAMTKLNIDTGSVVEQTKPVKINLDSPKDYIVTESTNIHWIDAQSKQIKSASLANVDKQTLSGLKGEYHKIHDIGLSKSGRFAAQHADGSEHVITKHEKKPLELTAFKTSSGQTNLWQKGSTGGQIVQGAFTETGFQVMVYDHKDIAKVTIHNEIKHDAAHGKIVGAITAPKSENSLTIILTSTGSIQGWVQGSEGPRMVWTREESLSDIKAHVVVDLPERKVEQTGAVLDQEGFVSRIARHIKELNYLPSYASSLVSRFTSGSYTKSLSSTPLETGNLFRDQFGFQKLVILATTKGQVHAVDSAHGNIVWKASLSTESSDLDVVDMWVVRSAPEFGAPVVAIVANKLDAGKTSTVAYHIDAFTGRSIQSQDLTGGLTAKLIADGPVARAFPIPVDHCKTHIQAVAIVAQDTHVHFFPSCNKIKAGFGNISSQTFFHSTETKLAHTSIRGFAIASPEHNAFFTYPTWALPLAADEAIVNVAELQQGVVAAYGRVLGDRTTLYKYLNPHLVAFATVSKSKGAGAVYVVDTTSGAIVHEARIPDVDARTGIQIILAENWLVYSYAENEVPGKSSRGQRIVSTELFEGAFPDERTDSISASTLTTTPNVHAIARTFLVPVGIKGLSMTTSMHGITYKDLILVTDRDQLVAVPKRMLDPRRPDVPSKRDKEEFLVPYQPMLFLDPKWTISHTYDVAGINRVITTPSLLESTSLIITTGLDLFGTRATPSGTFDILSDYFNKTQLMLTILGLGIGITVARPAVTRKVLKARWY